MSAVMLLVTAHHNGDLRFMARLHTTLLRLKRQQEGRVILIDTGHACSDRVWICEATENRAPYVVMDAMGYHLIFADGLSEEARQQLQSTLQAQLIAPEITACLTHEDHPLHLRVDATTLEPTVSDGVLFLPQPSQGMIRQIQIEVDKMNLLEMATISVPPGEALEPTMMAVVEFVESEARYYQQKKKGGE